MLCQRIYLLRISAVTLQRKYVTTDACATHVSDAQLFQTTLYIHCVGQMSEKQRFTQQPSFYKKKVKMINVLTYNCCREEKVLKISLLRKYRKPPYLITLMICPHVFSVLCFKKSSGQLIIKFEYPSQIPALSNPQEGSTVQILLLELRIKCVRYKDLEVKPFSLNK